MSSQVAEDALLSLFVTRKEIVESIVFDGKLYSKGGFRVPFFPRVDPLTHETPFPIPLVLVKCLFS